VIDAVLSRDAKAQRAVTKFEPMACTATPAGIGAFYCDEGEPDGTVSSVVAFGQCESFFVRNEDFSLQADAMSLYAAYRVDGGYAVVFSRTTGPDGAESVLILPIEHGRIVFVNLGCGLTPAEVIADVAAADLVLAPP
jgi:hypothetical protein